MPTHLPERLVCGPIDQQNTLIQYFRPAVDHLSGLSIKFGTYRKIMSHRLKFRLDWVDEDGAEGAPTPLFYAEVAAAGISDAGYFHMYFPTLARSKGRLLALTIASPDANPGDAVTAWLVRTAQRIPGHVRCHASAPIEEGFGLQANLITSNPEADITYPKGLLYSPLSSCNMNCIHCISRATRPRAIRLSERIRQDIKAHAQEQQLNWMFTDYSGDIFFAEHKQPGELDFIFSLGIAIHIDTNAAYLDAAMIEKVMASPVDALSISIDAAQDDTYRRIRVGSPPIGHVFDTAKAVVAERARQGRQSNFRVYLGFTMMRSNLHELPLFIQKAADAGVDAVGCRHLELYHADMEDESLFHHKAYFNSMRAACLALAKSLNINLNIGEELWEHPASGGRAPCPTPWSSAVLLANGDLMACCVPGSKMGNVNDQPIEALWQGEAYRRLRARVNSQDPPSLCKSCPFRNSLNDYANPQALRAGLSAVPLLEELMADTGRG